MSEETKKFRQIVRVEGKADKKNQAFSNALNQIHGKVLKDSADVTLRIEPVDTKIVLAEEESYTEKFLFFFLPRTRVHYHVVLDVEIEVTMILMKEVQFVKKNVVSPTSLPLPRFKKSKLQKEEI